MQKVFLNSLPKAGTNLVSKLLNLIGYTYRPPGIAATLLLGKFSFLRQLIRGAKFEKNPVIIGLDLPVAISHNWLEGKFSVLKTKEYMTGHANYSDHLYFLLHKYNIKVIQVIRDPRDVLISYVHYVARTPSHFIYSFYKNLSFEDRIRFTLEGGKAGDLYVESFPQMLKKVEEWVRKENIMVVKFEDLIGEKGGGSRLIQVRTIKDICTFLGVMNVDYEKVVDNLFGGTHTFRKGKIGSWKEELSEELKTLIEEKIGDIVKRWGYE